MDLDFLRWAGTTFASLLPLVNPLNAVPLFVVMTVDLDEGERSRQATKAGLYAGIILSVTAFAGAFILGFFGINLGMLQIAGGLIVGQAAWAMVTGNPQVSPTETSTWESEKRFSLRRLVARTVGRGDEEDDEDPQRAAGPHPDPRTSADDAAESGAGEVPTSLRKDIAFSPVAMPVLAGPAAMGVVVGLTSQSASVTADLGIFLGIAVITALTIVGLRASNAILRSLGGSGILALQRVFGFILLAIAVALVSSGISALFGIPLSTG